MKDRGRRKEGERERENESREKDKLIRKSERDEERRRET